MRLALPSRRINSESLPWMHRRWCFEQRRATRLICADLSLDLSLGRHPRHHNRRPRRRHANRAASKSS